MTGQSFDPFGAPIDPLNPAITRVGFTGQDQDVDLGLTDMKGRIYDPLGGRFTGVDPVMQAPFSSQGLNRYSYVFNDPINNTDPSGFDSTAWDVVGGIFTTGVVGLLCYGTGDCSGATLGSAASAASGGASIGLPFLSGFAGAARPGMSYSVAPTATPKSSSGSPGTTQVLGQNGPSNLLNAQPRGIGADPNAAPPNGPMDPRLGRFSPISETPVDDVVRNYGQDIGCLLGECKSLLDTTLAAVRIFSVDELRAATVLLQSIEAARLDALARVQAKDVDLDALADKKAGDLISGSLKKSPSYAGELADKTVGALREMVKGGGPQGNKAGKMLKLIKNGARLRAKNK